MCNSVKCMCFQCQEESTTQSKDILLESEHD